MSIQKGNYKISGTMFINIDFEDLLCLSLPDSERMQEVLNTVQEESLLF